MDRGKVRPAQCFYEQAFRPVPQRVNFLWNRPESLLLTMVQHLSRIAVAGDRQIRNNDKLDIHTHPPQANRAIQPDIFVLLDSQVREN